MVSGARCDPRVLLPFFLASLLFSCLLASGEDEVGINQGSSGTGRRPELSDVKSTIAGIYKALQKEQVQKSQPFEPFPEFQWQEDKGLYRSYVHLDFVGDWVTDLLRNYFAIPDSNMFVSSFVVSAILEAHGLGAITADEASLQMAVEAIANFHDKNRPADVPACSFWPQVDVNGTWSARPVNLVEPLKYFDSVADFVEAILNDVGLGFLADEVQYIVSVIDTMGKAFRIPADLDDSSVNLAMGGMLQRLSSDFPSVYSFWEKVNANISALYQLEAKYAYKPYGSPRPDGTDLLDPRTYYFLAPYFAQRNGKPPTVALTWLSDLEQDKATSPMVSMPFHTNNVDLSVSANFLYGTAHAALQDLNGGASRLAFLKNPDLQQLYTNTAELVAWGIESAAADSRPDLALLYYPSIYDFLWMAARTARFLASHNDTTQIPVLSQARDTLFNALYDAGTNQIIASGHPSAGGMYWDDFLGDYGGVDRGEDRLFSTALAINTLLDIWTTGFAAYAAPQPPHARRSCTIQWRPNTPYAVRTTVDSAVTFLVSQILAGKLPLENAFFSGSMKSLSTNPFAYPATYSQYINGTAVDPHTPKFPEDGVDLVYAMRGVVPPAQYLNMTQQKWFGYSVPTTFDGFNEGGLGPWPYWSSPAMTYAMSLIALANYAALQDC